MGLGSACTQGNRREGQGHHSGGRASPPLCPCVQGADSTHRGTPKLGQTLGLSVSVEYTAGLDGSCHTVCSLDMLGYFSS